MPDQAPQLPVNPRGTGPVTCCGHHRERCQFGLSHKWSTWYVDGRPARGTETWRCVHCGGVCTAEERGYLPHPDRATPATPAQEPNVTAPVRLTPLNPAKTVKYRNRVTRRFEVCEATAADEVWAYIRQEDEGTTWDIKHLPTGRVLTHFRTLAAARISTASGAALAALDATKRVPL